MATTKRLLSPKLSPKRLASPKWSAASLVAVAMLAAVLLAPPFPGSASASARAQVEAEGLFISEVMADNESGLVVDGQRHDWIELYNTGERTIDLTDFALTDDPAHGSIWAFPAVSLAPDELMVVFASGLDRSDPGAELHTDFKIKASGEYLGLIDPAGNVVNEYTMTPAVPADVTFGRATPAGPLRFYDPPTPGLPNGESGQIAEPEPPTADRSRGYFDEPFDLTLSSLTPGSIVIYTLDGSEPTLTEGIAAEGPVRIETTTVLRARAFHPQASRPSAIVGFSWISTPDLVADLGLDAAGEAALRRSANKDLTISMALPGGAQAINDAAVVDNVDVPRIDTSFEVLFPDERPDVELLAQVKKTGNSSFNNDKPGLRIRFDGELGGLLEADLFGDLDRPGHPPATVFEKLDLRAGGNSDQFDTLGRYPDAALTEARYLTNRVFADTQRELGGFSPHGRFVHVFINGEYRGVHNLREFASAHYGATYMGGERSDFEAVKQTSGPWSAIDGTGAAYERALAAAETRDWNSFLDHYHLPSYMSSVVMGATFNHEGELRLVGPVESAHPGGWVSWAADTDGALDPGSVWAQGLLFGYVDAGTRHMAGTYPDFDPVEGYRVALGDAAVAAFTDGGALTPERYRDRFDFWLDQLADMLPAEIARWAPGEVSLAEWTAAQRLARDEVAAVLANSKALEVGSLYLPFAPVQATPAGSVVAAGTVVELSSASAQAVIVYTMDGSDPRTDDGGLSPTAVVGTNPVAITVDSTSTIVARPRLDGLWSAKSEFFFDVDGPAPDPTVRINEAVTANTIRFDADGDTPDWFEIANLGAGPVSLAGWLVADSSEFWPLPAVTLDPDEVLMVWASGKNSWQTGSYHAGFKLSSSGEQLSLYAPGPILVDRVELGEQPVDVAFGLDAAGRWVRLGEPSPRDSNPPVGQGAGDVDLDGGVDADDVVATLGYVIGEPASNGHGPAGDLNLNGEVDLADAMLLARCIEGEALAQCPDLGR